MTSKLFSKQTKLNELFMDERALYPEFVPSALPHREKELEGMAYAFRPLMSGKKPLNVVLLGRPGTGKTACARHVMAELSEATDRARHVYVNCFESSSRSSVLSKIVNFLGYPVPRRGLAADEVYSRMIEVLKKADFVPVVVLDEVDQLLLKGEGNKLLYDLLRVIEFEKIRIGLAVISNDFELTSKMDDRVRSSLMEEKIVFEPYSPQQLKDILKQRVKLAFHPKSVDCEAINVCAAHAAKLGGDARIAIESLLKAGRIAERENAARLELRHLKKAFETAEQASYKKVLPFLKENEKTVLKILAGSQELTTGELFKEFCSFSGAKMTDRNFRLLLSKLQSLNLINAPLTEAGSKGRTRLVSLKISKDAFKEFLPKE